MVAARHTVSATFSTSARSRDGPRLAGYTCTRRESKQWVGNGMADRQQSQEQRDLWRQQSRNMSLVCDEHTSEKEEDDESSPDIHVISIS